jgi:hypothetical protein
MGSQAGAWKSIQEEIAVAYMCVFTFLSPPFLFVVKRRRFMRSLSLKTGCLSAALVAVQVSAVMADTMVALEASNNTWIRQSSPDSNYRYDTTLSVWALNGSDGRWRNALLQFDLADSSITGEITGAQLELYVPTEVGINDTAYHQTCYMVSPAAPTATFNAWTWNSYYGDTGYPSGKIYSATLLESLGHYTLAAGLPMAAWYDSDAASAGDLATINAVRTGTGSKVVTFSLESDTMYDGTRDFGAGMSGFVPRLVLTTAVPEPGVVVLLATSLLGLLAYAWRNCK